METNAPNRDSFQNRFDFLKEHKSASCRVLCKFARRLDNWATRYWQTGFHNVFQGISYIATAPITYDDVIKWKHFPRYWPPVRGIHRSPVNSPHTGQWRGALMFSLIFAWINSWVNNRDAGDLRRHHAHYDVNVITMMEGEIICVPKCDLWD